MAINGTSGDDTDLKGTIFNDEINGLAGNDTILGGPNGLLSNGDDLLRGGRGDDVLLGQQGSDQLFGGEDNDILRSGNDFIPGNESSDDFLSGGSGDDRLIVTTEAHEVEVRGGSDTDLLQIGFDADLLDGSISANPSRFHTDSSLYTARIDLAAGVGTYRYGGFENEELDLAIDLIISGVENVIGTPLRDTISGDAKANNLNGERGNNSLQGRGGADTLNGADGRDRAFYDNSAPVDIDLTLAFQRGGEAQGDVLISIEDIDGSRGADTIKGSSVNNTLFGNLGNDVLEGRGGADKLDGGDGIDTASYASSFVSGSAEGVRVTLAAGSNTGADAAGDVLTSVENLIGSSFNDRLTGSNVANRLEGGTGIDLLNGGGSNDTLEGGPQNDTLLGGASNDTLDGGTGNDTIDGEAGIDTATYAAASSAMQVILGRNGSNGSARQSNLSQTDVLRSIENVIGSTFDDAIFGNERNNELQGRQGKDVFIDGRGNDIINGGQGTDTLDLSTGTRAVSVNFAAGLVTRASPEVDTLISIERVVGTVFGDTFTSRLGGADRMHGSGGNDTYDVNSLSAVVVELANQGTDLVRSTVTHTLAANVENLELLGTAVIHCTGNALDNTIIGNDAGNTIVAREGNDVITGGRGPDSFFFNTALNAARNVDRITDFNVTDDTVFLDDAIFTGIGPAGAISVARFFIGPAAHDADDRIVYNSDTGAVIFDSNGNAAGGATQFATLAPNLLLTNVDFVLF